MNLTLLSFKVSLSPSLFALSLSMWLSTHKWLDDFHSALSKHTIIVYLLFQDRITGGIISRHTLLPFLFVFVVLELMR